MSFRTTPNTPHEPLVKYYALGFSLRKRHLVKRFVNQPIRFVYFGWQVPANSLLILWGNRSAPHGLSPSVKLIRLEDGFLRSIGLGADLTHPLSWVIDHTGIYYDATRPSDLENILNFTNFDTQILSRARALSANIISLGLTKYNLHGESWLRPISAQRVLLVIGQVESDASIQFGTLDIRTNSALLKTVRQANPDAIVLYKPHPDIVAGLRTQGKLDAEDLCNDVLTDVSMNQLLTQVDEVHVMTSLAGFEALLRGKTVFCYGQPFYAGWGLTIDHEPHIRRTRRLSMDQLIAGALILYPTYVSRKTHTYISPELALNELVAWRNEHKMTPGILRKFFRILLSRK